MLAHSVWSDNGESSHDWMELLLMRRSGVLGLMFQRLKKRWRIIRRNGNDRIRRSTLLANSENLFMG